MECPRMRTQDLRRLKRHWLVRSYSVRVKMIQIGVFQDGSTRIWTGNLSDSWLLGHMHHRSSNWPEGVGNTLVPVLHLHGHVINTPSPKWRGWVWPVHCLLLINLHSRSRAIHLNTFDKKQTNPLLCECVVVRTVYNLSKFKASNLHRNNRFRCFLNDDA